MYKHAQEYATVTVAALSYISTKFNHFSQACVEMFMCGELSADSYLSF
jgi:hypothetical protein